MEYEFLCTARLIPVYEASLVIIYVDRREV